MVGVSSPQPASSEQEFPAIRVSIQDGFQTSYDVVASIYKNTTTIPTTTTTTITTTTSTTITTNTDNNCGVSIQPTERKVKKLGAGLSVQ